MISHLINDSDKKIYKNITENIDIHGLTYTIIHIKDKERAMGIIMERIKERNRPGEKVDERYISKLYDKYAQFAKEKDAILFDNFKTDILIYNQIKLP